MYPIMGIVNLDYDSKNLKIYNSFLFLPPV